MIEVIPAILPQSLNNIKEQLDKVVGFVKKIQIDIVDGQYAPTKTWPFIEKNSEDLMRMERGEEKFPHLDDFIVEIDMMILHPIEYVPDLLGIGFKSFIIHVDSTDHIRKCLETIRNSDCRAGLGIKPSVDIAILESYLPLADFVQFMGNDKVGHNGVELDIAVLNKIKKFRERHSSVPIQVDIGVNFDTAPKLIEAGVTGLVSGSTIFNAPNIKEAIIKLQSL